MATTAGNPAFVDTNVLVYVSRPAAVEHARALRAVERLRAKSSPLWISRQVLREYLAVVTRPQATAPGLPMKQALADVQSFRSVFEVADDSPAVLDRLLRILAEHPGAGRQVHDANLVATMVAHGVTRLLTFNTADFRRFGGLVSLVTPAGA